jgi:hypothetical protein
MINSYFLDSNLNNKKLFNLNFCQSLYKIMADLKFDVDQIKVGGFI